MKSLILTALFVLISHLSFGQTPKVTADGNGLTESENKKRNELYEEIEDLRKLRETAENKLPSVGAMSGDCSDMDRVNIYINQLEQAVNAYEKTEARGLCRQMAEKYKELNGNKYNPNLHKCDQYDYKLNIAKENLQKYRDCLNNRTNSNTSIDSNAKDSNNINSSITSINNFETSYEVYNNQLQSAFNNSLNSNGDIDVANFVSNLPQATNKTQAYTNVAATGIAIAGQLMQARNARKEKEAREWQSKYEAWKEMYKSVKNGIGSKNENGQKTGTWIYFNDFFLIDKIVNYENGKIDGVLLTYKKIRFLNYFMYEDFMPVARAIQLDIYKDGDKIGALPEKLLHRKVKEPNYYEDVNSWYRGFNKYIKENSKNIDILDIGFYNSQDLDFTKKNRFKQYKIKKLRFANINEKNFPIGVFQLLNKHNVSIQEGLYNGKGQKIGNWYTFNPNNTYPEYDEDSNTEPIEKISYSEGKKQGEYFSQFWIGQFSNDRKVGLWKSKENNGVTIKFSSDGHTGLLEKKDSNGSILEKAIVYDTIYNGEYLSFYPNGSIKSKGQYKMGEKTGEWTFYDENGNLTNTQKI
ncbi:toxin-antitoxin system YwqK family antitoxin [Aurantibacter aestuarii]|uniref:Toxin-antitoxin system YwqK family antitoxin n=1 Tax=Aurantibacter aestuarii TaxID=1266046 RepID=A0A2T1NBD5_9FLAO|nr:hypothetical protein [Aurantibacter aestuarii]PSG89440.1 hypothetical protein C7H52_06610 [Aurantibacter aestuarii]